MQSNPSPTESACPRCEMQRPEWDNPRGVKQNGKTYCCEGCATDTGCTCGEDGPEEEEQP